MKNSLHQKKQLKKRRIHHKMKRISSRPRLVVSRSLKNISAQIIDDEKNITLVQANSLEIKSKKKKNSKTEVAAKVGKAIAQKALKKNIKKVSFDRSGLKYHGRIKALAQAARKEGLVF